MAPLSMEMVRDIDKDTVDFQDNYDGRTQEPTVLPSRFPNLLVNGSAGIAVGMATNIPPHNLREVAEGVQWHLDHPEASREELLAALLLRIKGPDFPTGATILGHKGIEEAYRTGPRLHHDARGRRGRGDPGPDLPGRHRAAVPGEPGHPGEEDRGPGPREQGHRHRGHPRRDVRPRRPAPGDRAQARRRREGRAEQPLQAHAAAGHVRREHARARRRRPAHAEHRRVRAPLGHPPARGRRPPHRVQAARGRGATSTSTAGTSRRSTRSTRSSRSSAAPPTRTRRAPA